MLKKNYIQPTESYPNRLEKETFDYYGKRNRGPLGYIGPRIKGIDVGAARYYDINQDYTPLELCTTPTEQKDYDFGGYRVRWFHPLTVTGNAPVIVFVHGGGYIAGTMDRYDKMNRRLAELINGIVMHVDYTLSPETGFPTALEQSYHVIEYIYHNPEKFLIDRDKIAIMGDSAGGNCCAALGLRDKETKYIKMEFLYYPVLDFTRYSADTFEIERYGEMDDFVKAKTLSLKDTDLTHIFLQNNEDPSDELISPLLSKDLRGYPRTIMINAEFDFLRQQCEVFCEKLDEAGVDVDYYQYNGTFHGFMDRLGLFESCDHSLKVVAKHLKEYFNL